MIFAILTLLTALSLATVAGWFSIVGFMAIYAGAPMQALIMGVVTETAKLVTASWIYRNWQYSDWKLKTPLLYFTIAFMIATSIGVFGFLSKHQHKSEQPQSPQHLRSFAAATIARPHNCCAHRPQLLL